MKEALYAPAAKERGIFREEYVERLLEEPNGYYGCRGVNDLWQIGLLELWLQAQDI